MNEIYQFTVPVFQKSLKALDGILVKAQAFAKEKGIEESTLLEARLAPDMFPLKMQVQMVCDNAKGASTRLSGMENPSHADEEQTIDDLRARITKTVELISGISESAFQEAATRHITLPYFPGKHMIGFDYAREYALPNFLFHVTTAYAILRKEGVQIGKTDFLGNVPMHDGE